MIEKNDASRILGALRDVSRMRMDSFRPEDVSPLAGEFSARMRSTFPARCAQIGEDGLTLVVRRAFECAESHGINNPRGVALCVALNLILGKGFDLDPQLPWVSKALSSEPADSVARTMQLQKEALLCLRQWWGINPGAEV